MKIWPALFLLFAVSCSDARISDGLVVLERSGGLKARPDFVGYGEFFSVGGGMVRAQGRALIRDMKGAALKQGFALAENNARSVMARGLEMRLDRLSQVQARRVAGNAVRNVDAWTVRKYWEKVLLAADDSVRYHLYVVIDAPEAVLKNAIQKELSAL